MWYSCTAVHTSFMHKMMKIQIRKKKKKMEKEKKKRRKKTMRYLMRTWNGYDLVFIQQKPNDIPTTKYSVHVRACIYLYQLVSIPTLCTNEKYWSSYMQSGSHACHELFFFFFLYFIHLFLHFIFKFAIALQRIKWLPSCVYKWQLNKCRERN